MGSAIPPSRSPACPPPQQAEVSDNESKYHLLNAQLHITDQNIKKITAGPAAERLREK